LFSKTFGLHFYLWNTTETTPDITGLLPGNYTLKITDEMNCSTQSTYEVLNTVGIEENIKSDFSVSPNPNDGKFTISSVSELPGDVTIDIFSLTGEKVYSSKHESSIFIKDDIDLSGIAPGLYVIRFSSAVYTKFAKVIINNRILALR
jgi:lysyl endopeptidase